MGRDHSDEIFRNDRMDDATQASASILNRGDTIEYTKSTGPCDSDSVKNKLSTIVSIKPFAFGGHRILLENKEQLKEGTQFVRRISSTNHVTGEVIVLPDPGWLMLGEYTLICDEPQYTDRVCHSSGLSGSEASVAARHDRILDRNDERRPRHLFPWTRNKDEYNEAAATLNACHRKLSEIGQRYLLSEGSIDIMTVTTKEDFMKKAKEINIKYKEAVRSRKSYVRLPSVRGVPDIVPM